MPSPAPRTLATLALTTAAVLTAAVAGPAPTARPDLDVGIPPGSPTNWASRIPVLLPGTQVAREPGPGPGGGGTSGTRTAPPTAGKRADGAFGVFRILTWDLSAHIAWLDDAPRQPSTGRGIPGVHDALHWTVVAALLRPLLHRQLVSEPETIAHLVELGEPAVRVLEAARTEPELRALCDETLAAIGGLPAIERVVDATPTSPELLEERLAETGPDTALTRRGRALSAARRAMWNAFLPGELVRAHAYDPEGGFGRRLLPFGREVVPVAAVQARHHRDPFVRRNAAALLSRFAVAGDRAAAEALAHLVDRVRDDDVVLMRALAGLAVARHPADPGVLRGRLVGARGRAVRAAVLETIGRVGERRALPEILILGRRQLEADDGDLLASTLAALARLGPPVGDDARAGFADFLDDVERRLALSKNLGLETGRWVADRPDEPGTRGRLLKQLLTLARLGLVERAETRARMLQDLAERPGTQPDLGPYPNRSQQGILPSARILFVEALGRQPQTLPLLARVADDPGTESILRTTALARLNENRVERLVALLDAPREDMHAQAFSWLRTADSERAVARARDLVRTCIESRGLGTAPRRQLWSLAVRFLAERRALGEREAVSLAETTRRPPAPRDLRPQVIARVDALIDRAAAFGLEEAPEDREPRRRGRGRRAQVPKLPAALREAVAELVAFVVDNRLSLARSGEVPQLRANLEALLGSVAGRPRDADLAKAVRGSLLAALLRSPRAQDVDPAVDLDAEILLAAGRIGTRRVVDALLELVEDAPRQDVRAHACLALGLAPRGRPEDVTRTARILARVVLEADPWIRLCAAEALIRITGIDPDLDWMTGPTKARTDAAEAWARWEAR